MRSLAFPAGRVTLLARASARVERHQRVGGTILFASAFAGLPPFYLTSITAGMTQFGFTRFVLLGTLGRFLRFGLVALLPLLARTVL